MDSKAELRDALRRELTYEISRGRKQLLLWTPGGGPPAAGVPAIEAAARTTGDGVPVPAGPEAPAAAGVTAAVSPSVGAVPESLPAGFSDSDPVFIRRGSGANSVPAWLDDERAAQFAKTRDAAVKCTKCALWKTRTHVVFGTGSGRLGVLFIGEAPGRDEDLTGEPFVGRAGQLLTKVLAALDWSREDVYIANVLKCRPPENRDPQPDEVSTCSPYLLRQIGLLQPKVLCALGNYAAQLLLNSRNSMARLRGRVLDFQGTPLVATYHPAAILRNPNLKKPLWEDMQLLKKTYESLSG